MGVVSRRVTLAAVTEAAGASPRYRLNQTLVFENTFQENVLAA
jgi:hypothetical protein